MNKRTDKFFVITGGPGVGKTTLIKALKKHGFNTIDEDARKIIKNQIEANKDGLPWKNKVQYANLMFEASMKSYNKLINSKNINLTFFDRGVLDSICYMKMEQIKISNKIEELIKFYTYNNNVFILPPWKEIYETDNERKQDWKQAELTYKKMIETYTSYNYNMVIVPKTTIEERIKFILKYIENL